jgi:hypothetical protein
MDPESDHETLHGARQGLLRHSAAVNLLIQSKSPTSAGCWGACGTGGSTASPKAIRELLVRLNEERPIRRLGVTRRQLHEELDRPVLKPLLVDAYVFAEWRARRVGVDYHVDVDGHYSPSLTVPSSTRAQALLKVSAAASRGRAGCGTALLGLCGPRQRASG